AVAAFVAQPGRDAIQQRALQGIDVARVAVAADDSVSAIQLEFPFSWRRRGKADAGILPPVRHAEVVLLAIGIDANIDARDFDADADRKESGRQFASDEQHRRAEQTHDQRTGGRGRSDWPPRSACMIQWMWWLRRTRWAR